MARPWSVAQSRTPELMDDPALGAGEHLDALRALARINAISRTASQLAAGVRRCAAASRLDTASIHVVDVACGGGDVTVDLARRLGSGYRVTGIDVSPRAIGRAAEHAASVGVATARFQVCDVLESPCPRCDVVVSSLFLHHLDDGPARDVLRGMAVAASLGGVVSDLVRSGPGLALAYLATYALTASRVARVDGPRSVRAARTLDEYRVLVAAAGLHEARVRRTWPERIVVEWSRAASGAHP